MKSNLKPIVSLVLIAMILPELLTGSSLISTFLDPGHLVILFLGYGMAVLLFREIAIRNNFSLGGIFILGFAFGVFNEGMLAKTLIRASELPISQYDHFGYFLGVSFPFTFMISLWHALASVLIPILLVYWLYPESSNRPWLNKKFTTFLSAVFLILGAMAVLGKDIILGTPLQLAVLLGLMIVSFLIARRFTQTNTVNETSTNLTLKPMWLGTSLLFTYFLFLIYFVSKKPSLIIFFIVFFLIVWGYYKILKNQGWLTPKNLMLFGIGNYLQNTILAILLGFTTPAVVERVATGMVATVLLTLLARKIKNSSK